MPRFFFHIRDGLSAPDDVGTDLPSVAMARTEAVCLAGGVIKDDCERLGSGHYDWQMDVTDSRGLVLFRLDFSVMDTAATMGMRPPATP